MVPFKQQSFVISKPHRLLFWAKISMGIQLPTLGKPSLTPEVSPNHPNPPSSKLQLEDHWALNCLGYGYHSYHFKNIFKLTITRVIHHFSRWDNPPSGGVYHPGSFSTSIFLPCPKGCLRPRWRHFAVPPTCPAGTSHGRGDYLSKWDFVMVDHQKMGFHQGLPWKIGI